MLIIHKLQLIWTMKIPINGMFLLFHEQTKFSNKKLYSIPLQSVSYLGLRLSQKSYSECLCGVLLRTTTLLRGLVENSFKVEKIIPNLFSA